MALIGAIRVAMGLDTAAYESGLKRAETKTRESHRNILASYTDLHEATTALMASFGVAIGAGFLVEQAKGALEFAASLGETALRVGVTVEQLQALQRQAAATGTSSEGMDRALQIFNAHLGQAQSQVPSAIRLFAQLGISREQLQSFNSGYDALGKVFDGLNNFRTAAERAAVGRALFGRGFAEMIPMISEGSAGLEEWSQRARESGEITSEQAQTAHEAEVELRELGITIRTVLASALVEFIPDAERLIGLLEGIGSAASSALGLLARVGNATIGQQNTRTIGHDLLSPGGFLMLPADLAHMAADPINRAISRMQGIDPDHRPGQVDIPITDAPARGGGVDPNLSSHRGGHRQSDAAEKRRLRDQHQFDTDLRREQIAQLNEAKNQTNDYIVQGTIQDQIIGLNREQYKSDLDLKVALHDMSAEQEAQLLQAYDQSDIARRTTLAQSLHADSVHELATMAENEYNQARARLQLEEDGARTAEERRRIELEMLDLDYEYKRLKYQQIVHEQNVYDAATREDAQRQLDTLDANYRLDAGGVRRRTMGPLEDYLSKLPRTAAEANEALQTVEAQGLSGLIDGLASAAVHVSSLSDLFKSLGNVAMTALEGILKIGLERGLLSLLGNFGRSPLVRISPDAPSLGFTVDASSVPTLPGFDTGGSIRVNGMAGIDKNVLKLNDAPIARVGRGESIDVGRVGAGGGGDTVIFDFSGAVMTEDLVAQMSALADAAAMRGAAGGAQMAQIQLAQRAARTLGRR